MKEELISILAIIFYAPFFLLKEARGEVDTGAREMLIYMAVFLALGVGLSFLLNR